MYSRFGGIQSSGRARSEFTQPAQICARSHQGKNDYRAWRHRLRLIGSVFLFSVYGMGAGIAQADPIDDAQLNPHRKDYEEANGILKQFSAPADSKAAYSLGLDYLLGRKKINSDTDLGLALIYLAAEAGDLPAQTTLSYLYDDGQYVGRNSKLAWFWAEKAAYRKYGPAQHALGSLYFIRNTPSDRISALMWTELALSSIPKSEPQRGFSEVQRDLLHQLMTPSEIDQAERAARDWLERN
jgi:TPR repeat protein